MRKTTVIFLSITLISLFTIQCSKQREYYFRKYYIDAKFSIIGKCQVSEKTFSKTTCYRFIYNENNKLIKVEYLINGKIKKDTNGIAKTIVEYEDGFEKRIYQDEKGKPVQINRGIYSIRLKLNRNNKKVSLFNYDKDDNLTQDEFGVAQYIWTLDDNGNKIEESCYGTDEKLKETIAITEYAIQRWKYYDDYWTDEELREPNYGQAIRRWKYDDSGNIIEESFYGADEKLIGLNYRHAIVRWKYDDSGNKIETSYYGTDEKLIGNNSTSIVRWKYDDSGNIIEKSYYVTDEKLKEKIVRYAIRRYKYDDSGNKIEDSYYGTDKQLKEDNYNIAIKRWKYDDSGNKIEDSYYGTDGLLKEIEGIAIKRWKYDDSGNIIEESYYGTDEKLREAKSGSPSAIVRSKYDDSGNIIELSFYGTDKQLKEDNNNIAMIRWKYDDSGNKIEVSYYGTDEQLTIFKMYNEEYDYAIVRWKYDDYGNIIEKRHYGTDGKLREAIVVTQSVIVISIYDDSGNKIKESYYGTDGQLKEIKGNAIIYWKYNDKNEIIKSVGEDLDKNLELIYEK